mmetsp:Transcript_26973/g.43416  ORF Transcript_26973/g.43416 Transcript_26973/m.43416 type:complete len:470 (-) Transcript_26973:319-1728(-)
MNGGARGGHLRPLDIGINGNGPAPRSPGRAIKVAGRRRNRRNVKNGGKPEKHVKYLDETKGDGEDCYNDHLALELRKSRAQMLVKMLRLSIKSAFKRRLAKKFELWRRATEEYRVHLENEFHFNMIHQFEARLRNLTSAAGVLSEGEKLQIETDLQDLEPDADVKAPRVTQEEDFRLYHFNCPDDEDMQTFIRKHISPLSSVFYKFSTHKGSEDVMNLTSWVECGKYLGLDDKLIVRRELVAVFRHHAIAIGGVLGYSFDHFIYALNSCSVLLLKRDFDLGESLVNSVGRLQYLFAKIQSRCPMFALTPEQVSTIKEAFTTLKDARSSPKKKKKSHFTFGGDEAEVQMQRIFEFYCSFGDKKNKTHLTSSKFYKMCKQCGILDHVTERALHAQDIDLCFSTVFSSDNQKGMCKRSLNYSQTRNALALLGRKCFINDAETQLYPMASYEKIRSELVTNFHRVYEVNGGKL